VDFAVNQQFSGRSAPKFRKTVPALDIDVTATKDLRKQQQQDK
jgi:hypothetical protein